MRAGIYCGVDAISLPVQSALHDDIAVFCYLEFAAMDAFGAIMRDHDAIAIGAHIVHCRLIICSFETGAWPASLSTHSQFICSLRDRLDLDLESEMQVPGRYDGAGGTAPVSNHYRDRSRVDAVSFQ
jgi:hypothetical protein